MSTPTFSRRNFLRLGAAAGIATALAPTVWVPQRTFFLPPSGGWPIYPRVGIVGYELHRYAISSKLVWDVEIVGGSWESWAQTPRNREQLVEDIKAAYTDPRIHWYDEFASLTASWRSA